MRNLCSGRNVCVLYLMIVLVMLIMNDHNHVNGDYHIVKMITSIIMLRTMIMTVIGNALECLAAVCLPWLPLSSFPCHHFDILFINVVLLHLCFTLDFASVYCIEAFCKNGCCIHCFQMISMPLHFVVLL